MLPLSAKQPLRFTPPGEHPDPPPVYLIRPATVLDRAAFRRDMTAVGARYHQKAAQISALRRALQEVAPANLDQLLADIDAVEAGGDLAKAALPAVAEIEQKIARADPRYAELIADNEHWLEVAPHLAFRRFVAGWENVSVPFAQRGGLVAEATAEALPADHVVSVGYEAIRLFSPTKDEEKNSAPPPPSPSGQATSVAAPSLPTEATDGRSAETSTPQIPA